MKSTFCFLALLLLFSSCKKNKVTYWDINHFTISDSIIAEDEEVKLLYYSNGIDNDVNKEYYYHFVLYSTSTLDTFNLLNPYKLAIKENDGSKVFKFVPENSPVYKILNNIEDIGNISNQDINQLIPSDSTTIQRRKKVFRDPNFDAISINNYPTIIGTIVNENTSFSK